MRMGGFCIIRYGRKSWIASLFACLQRMLWLQCRHNVFSSDLNVSAAPWGPTEYRGKRKILGIPGEACPDRSAQSPRILYESENWFDENRKLLDSMLYNLMHLSSSNCAEDLLDLRPFDKTEKVKIPVILPLDRQATTTHGVYHSSMLSASSSVDPTTLRPLASRQAPDTPGSVRSVRSREQKRVEDAFTSETPRPHRRDN